MNDNGPFANTRRRCENNSTRNMASNGQSIGNVATATPTATHPDSLPGPGIFHGHIGDRGLDWLHKFELWARCKGFNDSIKVAAMSLHLDDAAATWLQVLPEADRNNWEHLRAAFVARYGPSQQAGWQRVSQLWTTQQMPGEPVLDFIAKIQRLSQDANIPAELQIHAIINGLRPSLRTFVLRQNPIDIAALRQVAYLAEQTELPSVDASADAIRRIEEQLQQLTLHTLQSTSSGRNPSNDRRQPEEDRRQVTRSPSTENRDIGRRYPSAERSACRTSTSPSFERCPSSRYADKFFYRTEQRQSRMRRRHQESPTTRRRVTFTDDYRRAPDRSAPLNQTQPCAS